MFDFEVISENRKFYTKGLSNYNSLDIEINLDMESSEGVKLCTLIGKAIKEGLKIEDGMMVKGLLPYPVYFFKVKSENMVEILRVVLPDKEGFFPWDTYNGVGCNPLYKDQIRFDKLKVFYYQFTTDKYEFEELTSLVYDSALSSILLSFNFNNKHAISNPYKFITSKNELFYVGGYSFKNEESKQRLLESLFNKKFNLLCKDATEEQIKDLQNILILRNDEL